MEYAIAFAVVGVFIVIVFILGFKQRASDEAIAAELPEEVKQTLMNAPLIPVEGLPNGAVVTGYVYKINSQNEKNAKLTVVYYNRYYPNLRDKFLTVGLKVAVTDMQANNIGEGSYILMLFNEDKTPKPVFD